MHLLRLDVVLAAFDYDESSVAALRAAQQLAANAGATLHVVHVDEPATGAPESATVSPSAAAVVVRRIVPRGNASRR